LILAIDIGNSITHMAVYDRNRIIYLRKFPTHSQSAEKVLLTTANRYRRKIGSVGIASVVTGKNILWRRVIKENFSLNPVFINKKVYLPLTLNVKSPQKLGADRICNALAAYEYFGKKENVIAVDLGTAITYDVVLKSGEYLGGIISPGIETMAKSLHAFTSKLPMLKRTDMIMPKKVIGRNTIEAIRSGTLYSALASFEGIMVKIENELKIKFKIVLTGGFAKYIHASTKFNTVIRENLVLDGINYILVYNNGA
jgi:type III pantothenate kinase